MHLNSDISFERSGVTPIAKILVSFNLAEFNLLGEELERITLWVSPAIWSSHAEINRLVVYFEGVAMPQCSNPLDGLLRRYGNPALKAKQST
jgi:hypothetical protein